MLFRQRVVGWTVAVLAMATPLVASAADPCEQAGLAAEQKYALPPGLLRAIGQVESGRWDPSRRQLVAWPWAIDIDGGARIFESLEEAVRETGALQAIGRRGIDAGCFQISLLHHPDAFGDLRQAFDPQANADYAARFLVSLQDRLGSWHAAVAAYHSANPGLGIPYWDRVLAAWAQPAATPSFGIRVWFPSAPGSASAVVTLPTGQQTQLPKVVTP